VESVETTVTVEVVVVVVDVSVVELELDELVRVLEVVHVSTASPPSPLPWHPLPKEMGNEALAVLRPIASDVTKNTKTKPTRTRVALLVLSLLPPVKVDPVNIVYRYGSRIYIIIVSDLEFSKRLTPSIYLDTKRLN
jgi:hypothetical protein